MTGDSDKDRVLTQARAMVVRNYLVENSKLDDTRIKSLGLGKFNSPSENSKVQIYVYDGGPALSSAQNVTPRSQ